MRNASFRLASSRMLATERFVVGVVPKDRTNLNRSSTGWYLTPGAKMFVKVAAGPCGHSVLSVRSGPGGPFPGGGAAVPEMAGATSRRSARGGDVSRVPQFEGGRGRRIRGGVIDSLGRSGAPSGDTALMPS